VIKGRCTQHTGRKARNLTFQSQSEIKWRRRDREC